jgi:hypothetical protein
MEVEQGRVELYLMLSTVLESKKDFDQALAVIDRGLVS